MECLGLETCSLGRVSGYGLRLHRGGGGSEGFRPLQAHPIQMHGRSIELAALALLM